MTQIPLDLGLEEKTCRYCTEKFIGEPVKGTLYDYCSEHCKQQHQIYLMRSEGM